MITFCLAKRKNWKIPLNRFFLKYENIKIHSFENSCTCGLQAQNNHHFAYFVSITKRNEKTKSKLTPIRQNTIFHFEYFLFKSMTFIIQKKERKKELKGKHIQPI